MNRTSELLPYLLGILTGMLFAGVLITISLIKINRSEEMHNQHLQRIAAVQARYEIANKDLEEAEAQLNKLRASIAAGLNMKEEL